MSLNRFLCIYTKHGLYDLVKAAKLGKVHKNRLTFAHIMYIILIKMCSGVLIFNIRPERDITNCH